MNYIYLFIQQKKDGLQDIIKIPIHLHVKPGKKNLIN